MANVDLARWQFALRTINHFFFVPVTIGLAFLTALLQTAWYRSQRDEYLRLTRFFGTLLVINVAIGVVTGLVQEFQFGMNWSAYSRLVGNIFGAPLAMEGLVAFFLESTFLGLWLFGWDKLSRRVHLLTIWAVALGTVLSAAFIMAANSWMQHPVGYTMVNGKPVLNDIWAVFTNPVFVWGYAKVLLASLVTGAAVMLAVSAWQLRHGADTGGVRPVGRLSLVVLVPAILFTMLVGRRAGRDRGQVPADEDRGGRGAVDHLPAVLVLAVPDRRRQPGPDADPDHRDPAPAVAAGHQLLERQGDRAHSAAEPVQPEVRARLLRAERVHPVLVDAGDGLRRRCWSWSRAWGLWLIRRKKLATSRRFLWLATWAAVLPFLMNTAGWLLTESGRQPWIVQGIMLTKNGISPSCQHHLDVAISLAVFVLLYAVLATVDLLLMLRYSRQELPPAAHRRRRGQPVPAVQY